MFKANSRKRLLEKTSKIIQIMADQLAIAIERTRLLKTSGRPIKRNRADLWRIYTAIMEKLLHKPKSKSLVINSMARNCNPLTRRLIPPRK
jgi:K+-sensing histidine kinase KdpD